MKINYAAGNSVDERVSFARLQINSRFIAASCTLLQFLYKLQYLCMQTNKSHLIIFFCKIDGNRCILVTCI